MNFTPKRLGALARQTDCQVKTKNIPSSQLARRGCALEPCREVTQEQGEGAELGGRKGTSRNRASSRSTKVGEKSVGGLVDPVPRGPYMAAAVAAVARAAAVESASGTELGPLGAPRSRGSIRFLQSFHSLAVAEDLLFK